MSSKTPIDVETVKKNCTHYVKLHSKAVDVLRKANGKDNYKNIAKDLNLHETKVSGILKSAENLGLATKVGRIYKKVPGILQYMPKTNPKTSSLKPISDIVKTTAKKKPKLPNYKQHVPFGINFQDKPEKMTRAYLWLYLTENTLRELIRHVFNKEHDWWNKRVNNGIKKNVEDAKNEYPYDGAKRRDELEYTHLGQLKEIIITKNNWSLFLPFLKESNKNTFQVNIDKAIPSRNSIAHSTPLTGEDFKFVEVRFKDILKMIKN